jgi:two-component system sensor histidine kinase BaeS
MTRSQRLPSLARRMFITQMQITLLASLILLALMILIAPKMFANHFVSTGETDPVVRAHAEEALTQAGALALGIALCVSFIAAAVLSRVIGRRITQPIEHLAHSADLIGSGNFAVKASNQPFSDEVDRLGVSLESMGRQLVETENTRRRLLSDLAHEMRTPLATLELYADSLEFDLVPRSEALATIKDQIRRMQRLAQDLREVAMAQEHALAMEFDIVDLGEIVSTACIAFYPRLAEEGVDLHLEPATGLINLTADRIRLQQVLGNILDNAARHTESGGSVTVNVGRASTDAVIRITDTGTGIETGNIEQVFERFYRADPSRVATDGSGSGLGLTIARAIVEAHGGSLVAASKGLGHGTTLTLTLPTLPLAPIQSVAAPQDTKPAKVTR